MDYLVRFAQTHESFRLVELQAVADGLGIEIEVVEYYTDSPYAIIKAASNETAAKLVAKTILTDSVHELWGTATTYEELHVDLRRRSAHLWPTMGNDSFRFSIHGFKGKRDKGKQIEIIERFRYLDFPGPILMKNPDHEFRIFEEFEKDAPEPHRIHFCRWIGGSSRGVVAKYDLKRRKYIATTSMDAELALVTANIAQAAPGKLIFDPFVGTGSFSVACAHFGAVTFGGDIDGRPIRGRQEVRIDDNFRQYGLASLWLGALVSDMTNTALRKGRWLDAVVCDPPYGVREGCKVLGSRRKGAMEARIIDGVPAHQMEGFIAPKKPFSFLAMLDHILHFSAEMLVDNGRLAMWMPVADEKDAEIEVPKSQYLDLVSSSVQSFGLWSRRLLAYRRKPGAETGPVLPLEEGSHQNGHTADELNDFRKRYFEGFKKLSSNSEGPGADIPIR